jgi:hypothetical protein
LAPEAARNDHSLADLLAAMPRLNSGAEVWPYVSRLPTGLHLLAAPARAEVMEQITPVLYGDLLAFLGQYYEVVLLALGTGITDPLARFAVQRADQVAVVTTPEWIAAEAWRGDRRAAGVSQSLRVVLTGQPVHHVGSDDVGVDDVLVEEQHPVAAQRSQVDLVRAVSPVTHVAGGRRLLGPPLPCGTSYHALHG